MIILIIIIGLVVGSFISMLVYRIPVILFREWRKDCQLFLAEHPAEKDTKKPMNLALPSSHCPHCEQALKWYHNIPIVGYLIQGGRCTHCHKKIPLRYPIIELLATITPIFCYAQFGFTTSFYLTTFLSWIMILQSYIDIEHQIIPDQITLPILWLGLFINTFNVFTDINSAIFGAIAGYLSLWIFAKLFFLITKKEGMGHGDFKLLAMLGAWLGWQVLPLIILMSSLIGAITGIAILLIKKQDKNTPIPFGPFLALAGWITLIYGQPIIQTYLNLLMV